MAANQEAFLRICVPQVVPVMKSWLSSPEPHDRVLAFNLFADFLEHLKGRSAELWDQDNGAMMQKLMESLVDKESEVRVAASFATNLAFRVPEFASYKGGQVATHAFDVLTKVVMQSPKPKNKDTNAKLAFDNAVAAMCMALIHCPNLAPEGNADKWWDLAFQRLPLKFDEDESQKLNEYLFDKVAAQDPATLGADNKRLGKLLGIFGDVYSTELITDELKEKIKGALCSMPSATLEGLAAQFTEKQKKKITKIVSSAKVN